jgi:uncharacterized surface protein with fasciclin (FAS1) repeats
MKSTFKLAIATLVMGSGAALADMHGNPDVGGAPMFADRNIVENAVNSADHTTLVAAVQAAGLVDTLQSQGPFTVFAPVNAAFSALPAGTVETLLLPENRDQLAKVLTCHVVADELFSSQFASLLANGGVAKITTVGGCVLEGRISNGMLELTDETGGVATVTIADVDQSNGVIHVIDKVLLPR